MKTLFAIAIASAYGVTMRILFGFLGDIMGIMSLSFLAVLPMLIGYLTIHLSAKRKVSRTTAFTRPWITSAVILVITYAISVEGLICWLMIFPFFAILAGFGGMIANSRKKTPGSDDDLLHEIPSNWNGPDSLKISLLAVFPLVLGLVEGDKTLSTQHMTIEKEMVIAAPAARVWQEAMRSSATAPKEQSTFLLRLFSFPHHLSTELDTLAVGGHRKAIYEKGLVFDEVITQYRHQQKMVVAIHADPRKIPPTVMDEHIVIGGKHVDIQQDTYTLEPLANGSCRLRLSSRFSITTPFNWYSAVWARYLMSDILEDVLNHVQERAVH